MRLSERQIGQFDREGYLFFRSLFTPAEIKTLLDEVPALYAQCLPDDCLLKPYDVPLPWKDGTPAEELRSAEG